MTTVLETLGRILVIIPTYNEAQNIASIVGRVRKNVPAAEILIADDNSPDGTGEIADQLSMSDNQVHVLHRVGKEGLGAAYIAGFNWGLEHGYDVLIEMDADGSHQPEQLPGLLQGLKHADMVKGSRWMTGGSVVNWDAKRELLSRAANIWIMAAMDLPIHDSTGGYNLYRADILRRIDLASVASRGYTFQVDLTRRVLEAGGTVGESPIEFREREFGESKMSGNIIGEALVRTAGWGVERRTRQLKRLGAKIAGTFAPLTDKIKANLNRSEESASSEQPRRAADDEAEEEWF
jgi:glycosyltransferase involved in cell wall biosynthesis